MGLTGKFPKTFWVANSIELVERWAWYGFYLLFANYLTGSSDKGGLEFSQIQKGWIMGLGTAILYFLPVLTGAIADRYGYKKVLLLSIGIYASAFLMLPLFSTFTGVFLMFVYLAVGAALFKPVIAATIAKTTTSKNASIGFGVYYMMINIGAFFGPMVTLLFKEKYHFVFYVSAAIICLNFILLFFYKEPSRGEARSKEPISETLKTIFRNMTSILHDIRFLLFLLIVAGFWTMYNQLFFTLPVFIGQWVDTGALFSFFNRWIPFISENYSEAPGVMSAEFVTNMDALYIILLQVVVSGIVMRLKPLKSMISGFMVCCIGMSLTFVSQNVLYTLIAILIFAIGEMAGSPKITEYIGRIAPADKKALYMGYSFIPVFLGSLLASYVSGNLYQQMSDKVTIVQKYAAEHQLLIPADLSIDDYFNEVAHQLNMSSRELTNILWELYDPSRIWMVLLGIGLVTVAALYVYDRYFQAKDKL